MRIGSRGFVQQAIRNINTPASQLHHLYVQLTSGRRLTVPSDDPVAAARALRGRAALGEIDSRRFVINSAQQVLGAADVALGSISEALSRCRVLALQGSQSHLEQSERSALAQEIRYASQSLVTFGNEMVQDRYIFAGSANNLPPFERVNSGSLPVLYHANHQQVAFRISPSETAEVGITGAHLFNFHNAEGNRPVASVDADVFSLLEDLADSIERGDYNRAAMLGDQVEQLHAHTVTLRGRVGVMAQRFGHAMNLADASEIRVRELLSADEDIDFAAAMVELSRQETLYQAVLGSTARMLQMRGLFEMQW